MANFANIPPKRKIPVIKKDWQKFYAEQRSLMMDIIEEEGTIGQARLKIKCDWDDGTFFRRKAEIIELFPGFINWNRNSKIFTWIKPKKIDTPLTEKQLEKSA